MAEGGPAPELTGSTPGSPSSPSAGPRCSAARTRRSQGWHESPWHGRRGQLRGCSGRERGGTEGHTLTFSPFIPWMPGSPWQGKAGAGRCSVSPSWSWGQPSPPQCHLPCPLWVPRGRVRPGGTEGTSGVLRCHRCASTPIITLTETPSLPGAPGSPRGPGWPGIPMAPSIPSGTVGHSSHGSPCPVGAVRLGGDPRVSPRAGDVPVATAAILSPSPSPHPPFVLWAPGLRADPAGENWGGGCSRDPLAAESRDDPGPAAVPKSLPAPQLGSRPLSGQEQPRPRAKKPGPDPGFGSRLSLLTGVPGDPPGPGVPGLPWSQRWGKLSSARGDSTALSPL